MPEQSQTDVTSGNSRGSEQDVLQEEIHRTRERIDETVGALEDKLSPGELIQRLLGYFRQDDGTSKIRAKAGDMLSSLGRTVKDKPVSSALIGIGLLGLASDSERAKKAAKSVGQQNRQGEGVLGSMSEAADKVEDLTAEAREALEHGYERVRNRIEDDPIVLGAIGVALGAALGASLPRTRLEDETFGETRDELAQKAKDIGEQLRHEMTS